MMDDIELCVMFRQAKNQKEQIRILSELNGVPIKRIVDRLEACGCVLPELPASWLAVPKSYDPDFDAEHAKELFLSGKTDADIAKILCCSERKFIRWRSQNGLYRKAGAASHRKREEQETSSDCGKSMGKRNREAEKLPRKSSTHKKCKSVNSDDDSPLSYEIKRLKAMVDGMSKSPSEFKLMVNGKPVKTMRFSININVDANDRHRTNCFEVNIIC